MWPVAASSIACTPASGRKGSISGTILFKLLLFAVIKLLMLPVYPRGIPATEVARVQGPRGFAVLMVPVGSSLTRPGRPSATVRK